MSKISPITLMAILTSTMVSLVQREQADLTARQMAVLLVCESSGESQTVRGLARHLNVAKPVITRAVDKLADLGLLERREDKADRRSVLIRPTRAGSKHVSAIANILISSAKTAVARNEASLAA